MESANLATRTYTAQTCSLSVTTKPPSLPHLPEFDRPKSGEFTLHIDRGENSGAEPIRLNGQLEQLDKLQQLVNQYVAQLVAQFPLETAENADNDPLKLEDFAPEPIAEAAVVNHLYPTSGLAKNLPGLRKSPQLAVANIPAPKAKESHAFSAASISKLLSRANPNSATLIAPESQVAAKSGPNDLTDRSGTLPRLTVGDRSLEHKLYLSDNNSGRVLTLTQGQLFDLESTLKQYTNAVATNSSIAPQHLAPVKFPKIEAPTIETPKVEALTIEDTKVEAPKIETLKLESPKVELPKVEAPKAEQSAKFSSIATTSALSRLPNLPSLPAKNAKSTKTSTRSYDYGDESRPAFMSAIPWVTAAALVVGVPFLLFGSNPDLLKESMAKVKMPSDPRELFNNKVTGSNKPEQPATKPTGDGVANAATAGLPKPWESKPVEPPAVPAAGLPSAPTPQSPSANEIGVAPLPPSIMNIAEERASAENLPSSTTPGTPATPSAPNPNSSSIAPNPLSSGLSTTPAANKQPVTPGAKPSTPAKNNNPLIAGEMPNTKPNPPVSTKPKTNNPVKSPSPSVPSIAAAPKPNQVKKVASQNTANIGVSPQPINLPPAFDAEPPLTAPPFPTPKSEQPTSVKQPQKVVVKSKPKRVAVAKKVSKVIKPQNSQQKKPPIIVPVEAPDPSTIPSEFTTPAGMPETPAEAPQIITQPQLQSNSGSVNPFENSSLKETKRYFQDKWRADSSQGSTLQYIIQVNGKSGVVQSVNPQGDAARTYLKKTNVLKAGQKLVPSTTTGESDQKIRVLLHPDGNVDTFVEP